jgi:hypothetical protein
MTRYGSRYTATIATLEKLSALISPLIEALQDDSTDCSAV